MVLRSKASFSGSEEWLPWALRREDFLCLSDREAVRALGLGSRLCGRGGLGCWEGLCTGRYWDRLPL